MSEGRWSDEGFWDWNLNLEGQEKSKATPNPEALNGLRAFLAAGGVENDAEIGAVMKDVIPVLAGYRRFHSWAILMRAMGHNDGGLLRALTDMHRDLKRGVSDFFKAVRESGIEFDDSALITAMLEVDEAFRDGPEEIPF